MTQPARVVGSAKARRRDRYNMWLNRCGCWYCTSGKVKKAIAARDKRTKRRAIEEF